MSWSLPRNTRDKGMESASPRNSESTDPHISRDLGGYIRPFLRWLGQ